MKSSEIYTAEVPQFLPRCEEHCDLKKLVKLYTDMITKLKGIIEKIEGNRRKALITQTSGAAVASIGTLTLLSGLALAPITLGASMVIGGITSAMGNLLLAGSGVMKVKSVVKLDGLLALKSQQEELKCYIDKVQAMSDKVWEMVRKLHSYGNCGGESLAYVIYCMNMKISLEWDDRDLVSLTVKELSKNLRAEKRLEWLLEDEDFLRSKYLTSKGAKPRPRPSANAESILLLSFLTKIIEGNGKVSPVICAMIDVVTILDHYKMPEDLMSELTKVVVLYEKMVEKCKMYCWLFEEID